MGTPLYMSPEQVENRPVDHRADLYSFGATSFFMFAGEPPFRGDTPVQVAHQHVYEEPPPLAELRPDLPLELCAMIHKLMAKRPEARYQAASEVAREIARLREALLAASGPASLTGTGLRSGAMRSVRLPSAAWRLTGQRYLRHMLAALAVVGAGRWSGNRLVSAAPCGATGGAAGRESAGRRRGLGPVFAQGA